MAVSENLAVQHHQQDTDYYCGAACAQMVLETIGAGILDQDDLYADNNGHSTIETNWYTGPDGLQWTMNDRRPAGFGNYFALFSLDTEEQISRKICWTIHHYQVAPIALVYGWDHWLVVRGYTASAHPASSADNSYTIDSFDLNNPWPPVPSSPATLPPPHDATDGCGSGGTRGIANENVTYATWQSTYMTGVPGGHWSGKFVAVCDPEPPAKRGGPRPKNPERHGDGSIIGPNALAELALAGLRDQGLLKREDWAHLRRARPSGSVLVERLDRRQEFYALVPLRAARRTMATVSVDARWGFYRQAALTPEDHDHPWISQKEALDLLLKRRVELPERLGRLRIRKEIVCLYPHLVWRPCRESLSPYYPFYMFSVGNHRLYVRIDGEVFSSLTLNLKGI